MHYEFGSTPLVADATVVVRGLSICHRSPLLFTGLVTNQLFLSPFAVVNFKWMNWIGLNQGLCGKSLNESSLFKLIFR